MAGARRRVDDRRHRPAEVEVGDGLHRGGRIHAHELRRPRARGDDGHPRAHAARGDAVAVLVDRLDADVARAPRGRRRTPRRLRPHGRSRRPPGTSRSRPGRRGCRTAARSGLRRAPRTAPRTLRVRRGSAAQSPRSSVPCSSSKRRPLSASSSRQSGKRLLREPHPALVRIGQADDPRAAVARAARRGRARTARRRRRRAPPARAPARWRAPSPRLRRRRPRCRRRSRGRSVTSG